MHKKPALGGLCCLAAFALDDGQAIDYNDNKRLLQTVEKVELFARENSQVGDIPSANLSVTVTSTDTGEAIWFYDSVIMLSNQEDLPPGTYSFNLERNGYCKQWGTRDESRALKTKTVAETCEIRRNAADYDLKKQYGKLVRELIHDRVYTLRIARKESNNSRRSITTSPGASIPMRT